VVDFPNGFLNNSGVKHVRTARKKEPEFPKTVTVSGIPGIEAKIYRQVRTKPDKDQVQREYASYILSYVLLGKRKMEAYADLDVAEAAGEEAIKKIANGEQQVLELHNGDRFEHQRAKDILAGGGFDVTLDAVATVYVDCMKALGGKGTPVEACREHAKRHGSVATKIMVPDAVKEMIQQEEKQQDGKRKTAWVKLLKTHVQNKFAEDFNKHVHVVEPADMSKWISGLSGSERTKKNIRDTVAHFFKWCRGRGYLPRDADPLADVQDFRKRRRGKIAILEPDELRKLLSHAQDDFLPYIALRAFAGLRDAEARLIDWRHVDLQSGWIEITEEVAKASDENDGTRRLIPIRDCLKAWLAPHTKESGRVCPFDNTAKQIAALCEAAGVGWKRNCLRHSYISYAVAESCDIPQVAIYSGNSPAVIRQHYLRVVKPELAKAWFDVRPGATAGQGQNDRAQRMPPSPMIST
jgi:integrase